MRVTLILDLWPKYNNYFPLFNQFCLDILPITPSRGKVLITPSYPMDGINMATALNLAHSDKR